MDDNERDFVRGDRDDIEQVDRLDDGTAVSPAAGTIIAANLAGSNLGSSTAATGAAAIGAAGEVAAEEDRDLESVSRVDASNKSTGRETGDEGVSPQQSELEAGELNG